MVNPLAAEARALTDEELAEAINEAYREVFNLHFQKGTRQLNNPMAIRKARRQLARLRTIRHERLLANIRGVALAPDTAPAEHTLSPQKRRAQEERAAAEKAATEAPAAASPDDGDPSDLGDPADVPVAARDED